jgi:ABC-type branched-subunit amino acid transport system substrate-binding protein
MKRKLVSGILIGLVLMLLAVPLAACRQAEPAPPAAPAAPTAPTTPAAPTPPPAPVKPDSVRIGLMGGMTGPAAASVSTILQEMEYVFDYINEVEGGIDGVKVELKIVDNKGTPEGAVLSYKELSAWDPVIYLAIEGYYYLAVAQQIAEDRVPVLTASAIVPQAYVPAGVFYSASLALPDGLGAFIDYVKQDFKGSGNPKLGVLYWDLPSGQQHQMAIPYAMQQGVDLVPVQFPIALMDLKPQLLQLQEAGVDYIWMMGLTGNAAVAVRDVRGLDIQVPFCFNEYVEPNVLVGMVGAGAQGFLQYRSEAPFSEGSEAADLYTKVYQRATGESSWSDNRISLTVVAAMKAAIEQAAADVGWDNLNGAAVMAALNQLETIDNWDNTGKFGYGPDRRLGITQVKMSRYTADGTEAISDWIDLPRIFEGIAIK